jgi:hypothetical protein
VDPGVRRRLSLRTPLHPPNKPWVLIGLPVYRRDWILPTWFEAIRGQDWSLDQVGFIFEVAPDDPETVGALFEWHGCHPEVRCFEVSTFQAVCHNIHPDGGRIWNEERYNMMANMRNRLLDRAVCYDPDRYLSLDSDIILEDPTTIRVLFELTEHLDAVSPLTFMTPDGVDFPNVMSWLGGAAGDHGSRLLYPIGALFQADIIMAVVMMSKPVYQAARYSHHRQGEDLGWATDCAHHGFKMWSASYLYASHQMHPSRFEDYILNGDSRRGIANPRLVEAAAAGAVVVSGADA